MIVDQGLQVETVVIIHLESTIERGIVPEVVLMTVTEVEVEAIIVATTMTETGLHTVLKGEILAERDLGKLSD